MRKKLILLVIFFILILSTLIVMKFSRTKIPSIVNIDLDEVTKISFKDWRSGELAETDDINEIKWLIDYLKNGLVLRRKFFSVDKTGYSHYIDVYMNDKKVMRVYLNRQIDINGTKYNIIYDKYHIDYYLYRRIESLK